MSVEAQTSKRSKNLLSKKQSSPGTFKVEKPKKMKRSTKGSASEDKLLKKKIKKEPLNSDIEGMEFNVKVSPKKHVREDKLFKKQIKKESLNSDVEGMEFNVKGSQKKHLRGQENPVPSSSIKVEINVKKKKALSVKNGKAFVPNLKQDQAFEKKKKKRPLDAEGSEDAPSPKKAKFSPKKSSKFQSMSKKGFTAPANKFTTNSSGPSEKPDWSKVKEERQALREKRRAAERDADSYEVSIQAKKVLESIRSRKCPAAEQSKQLDTLYSLLKGKLLSVVYAHDMSRVVETMLKFAHTHKKSDLLSKIIKELIPEVLQMSKRKYATHVVRAMIAHSSPVDRAAIVKAFCGHCVKLLSHKIGNVVLEQLYVKCKPEEQSQLFRELYGGSQKLISSEPVTGLEVIFKNLPNMKESTLTNTKEVLTGLFEKNVVHSQMIHSVLLDYLSFATPDESSEMLGLARNHIKALTQSKDGVHVAMMCVWMGSSKERKKIIKDLKEGVVALANGEHTHMLLLAIFDSMDDTVLVQKALLTELLAGDLKPLLSNTYGRKVLMYLCSRRDPKMFSSPIVATLATGDSNPHSKKDANVRALELQKFAVPFILEHIAQNTNLWMENNSNLLILLAAIKVGFGNHLPSALKAIASHVVSPPNSEKEGVDLRIADNTGCHMILKKLAQHDKVATENGHASFGEALLAELSDQHYQAWLGNNHCCFLLLEVLKNSPEEVSRSLQSKIKSHSASVWKRKESIPAGGKRILEVL